MHILDTSQKKKVEFNLSIGGPVSAWGDIYDLLLSIVRNFRYTDNASHWKMSSSLSLQHRGKLLQHFSEESITNAGAIKSNSSWAVRAFGPCVYSSIRGSYFFLKLQTRALDDHCLLCASFLQPKPLARSELRLRGRWSHELVTRLVRVWSIGQCRSVYYFSLFRCLACSPVGKISFREDKMSLAEWVCHNPWEGTTRIYATWCQVVYVLIDFRPA